MVQMLWWELRLYRRLVVMQWRAQMQYKVDLVIDILTTFLLCGLEFAALLLYFVPFPTLLGWHVGEVALLSAVTSLGFGIAELFGPLAATPARSIGGQGRARRRCNETQDCIQSPLRLVSRHLAAEEDNDAHDR